MDHDKRYPELDALRGIAVAFMVLYHLVFDLAYFYEWNIPDFDGIWKVLARASATTFLLLVGICFMISWERRCLDTSAFAPSVLRRTTRHDTFWSIYKKYLRRGLIIFSGGILISFTTWLIVPHAFVKFGILHLIGISALLQPLFAPLRLWNAFFGLLIITFPLPRPSTALGVNFALAKWGPFLFPLGIPYPGFLSLDYYPLIPWFGVILIGMALGNLLYVPTRSTALTPLDRFPYPLSLLQCGRWSLWIYFVHQPMILLTLSLVLGMPTHT